MPPRAVSNTGGVHLGVQQHVARALGPLQSPLSIWRPFTYTPSVLVMPTQALGREQVVRRRAVVVLPLVPVTATTGMRRPGRGRRTWSTMASADGAPLP